MDIMDVISDPFGVMLADWLLCDHNIIDSLFFLTEVTTMITQETIRLIVQEEIHKLKLQSTVNHNYGSYRDTVDITLSLGDVYIANTAFYK